MDKSVKDIDEIIAEVELGKSALYAEIEPRYNGWASWATWHAQLTLTGGDEALYAAARAEAARARDAEAFAKWALPRYLDTLRRFGEPDPAAYAEPDKIDWSEVWAALRAD